MMCEDVKRIAGFDSSPALERKEKIKGMIILTMLAIAIILFTGYTIWFRKETERKLKLHQLQWDSIKKYLPPDANVLDEYAKFCDFLKCIHANEVTGACFPHI